MTGRLRHVKSEFHLFGLQDSMCVCVGLGGKGCRLSELWDFFGGKIRVYSCLGIYYISFPNAVLGSAQPNWISCPCLAI